MFANVVALAVTASTATTQAPVASDGSMRDVFLLTVLVLLGLFVPLLLMGLSWWFHRTTINNDVKSTPYECGIQSTVGTAEDRFSVKFYIIAMLFLVFDIEVAFLYPWAVHFEAGGWPMIGVLLVFLVILEAGYLYLFRKGALNWED